MLWAKILDIQLGPVYSILADLLCNVEILPISQHCNIPLCLGAVFWNFEIL